jgi:hypothetical protein
MKYPPSPPLFLCSQVIEGWFFFTVALSRGSSDITTPLLGVDGVTTISALVGGAPSMLGVCSEEYAPDILGDTLGCAALVGDTSLVWTDHSPSVLRRKLGSILWVTGFATFGWEGLGGAAGEDTTLRTLLLRFWVAASLALAPALPPPPPPL